MKWLGADETAVLTWAGSKSRDEFYARVRNG
jgi:hypothetical protein